MKRRATSLKQQIKNKMNYRKKQIERIQREIDSLEKMLEAMDQYKSAPANPGPAL